MDRGRRDRRGPKRLSELLWLVDEHRDELQLELLRNGRSLDEVGGRLTWHDAWLIASHAAPGGPLASALDPRMAWTRTDWWLQSIEYSLRWLVWAKTKDGQRNRKRPEPIPAPKPRVHRKPDPELVSMDKDALDALLRRPRVALE